MDIISKKTITNGFQEYDYAACNLSSLPDFYFWTRHVVLSSRGDWFTALNVDASVHAVHGMKKHVKFGGPAQSSAVVCSVVTASRCEVVDTRSNACLWLWSAPASLWLWSALEVRLNWKTCPRVVETHPHFLSDPLWALAALSLWCRRASHCVLWFVIADDRRISV